MNNRKDRWTEQDIVELKGQEESLRLELKAGALMEKPQSGWVSDLSKEVSAFANTEGGVLVIGLTEEKKGKRRIAGDADGVSESIGTDQLQRLIEGNVSPYLPGIRVHRVSISSLPGRVVFVVDVPQGTTAYQANDGRYYGRSEFEAKFLPDHEIRLRMARGKIARASVTFRLVSITFAAVKEAEQRQKHSAVVEALETNPEDAVRRFQTELSELRQASLERDDIEFELIVRNDGELTIRGPALQFSEQRSQSLVADWRIAVQSLSSKIGMPREIIYPNDERVVQGTRRKFSCGRESFLGPGDYVVGWKVFLDNSSPSYCELDLGQLIQTARTV